MISRLTFLAAIVAIASTHSLAEPTRRAASAMVVYSMDACPPCARLETRLQNMGQRVTVFREKGNRHGVRHFPLVEYSDGLCDNGQRVFQDRITTTTKAVKLYKLYQGEEKTR